MELRGRTAIVTGAGSGIGRELALEFARADANVVCCGRTEAMLHETVEKIAHRGGTGLVVRTGRLPLDPGSKDGAFHPQYVWQHRCALQQRREFPICGASLGGRSRSLVEGCHHQPVRFHAVLQSCAAPYDGTGCRDYHKHGWRRRIERP